GVAETSRPTGGVEIRRCPECGHVHRWSAKCPYCNYIYQIKDRSVEEIFGEMRNITRGAEYESQTRFAHRCKLSRRVIARHVRQKELPTYGARRLVKIKEALALIEPLRENKAKYESQVKFGKRVGVSIGHLIARGLPRGAKAAICIEDALAWLRSQG